MPIKGTCEGLAGHSVATDFPPPSPQPPFLRLAGWLRVVVLVYGSRALFGDSHVTKALPLHHLWHSPVGYTWLGCTPHFWELGALQGVLGRATRSPQSRHTDANPFVDPGRAGGWNETPPQTKTSNNNIMNCFQHTPGSCGALINPRGEHHTKKASLHKHA